MNKQLTKASKFLSLVLRHNPGAAGVVLDESGWCQVSELLTGCARAGKSLTREELGVVIRDNDKKRFQLSDDGKRIRAAQGHSIAIDLGYEPQTPPGTLYHGTATRFLDSIRGQGLVRGSRQHVHLSAALDTAKKVGSRHGAAVVIPVLAGAMHQAGIPLYLAANGVWLVDAVPTDYLDFACLVF
jgi:putative RNA 2'-phosphotransferase